MLCGLAGALAGAVLLVIQDGVALTVAGALLVLAVLDLVVTGAIGHCPLYRRRQLSGKPHLRLTPV